MTKASTANTFIESCDYKKKQISAKHVLIQIVCIHLMTRQMKDTTKRYPTRELNGKYQNMKSCKRFSEQCPEINCLPTCNLLCFVNQSLQARQRA